MCSVPLILYVLWPTVQCPLEKMFEGFLQSITGLHIHVLKPDQKVVPTVECIRKFLIKKLEAFSCKIGLKAHSHRSICLHSTRFSGLAFS